MVYLNRRSGCGTFRLENQEDESRQKEDMENKRTVHVENAPESGAVVTQKRIGRE